MRLRMRIQKGEEQITKKIKKPKPKEGRGRNRRRSRGRNKIIRAIFFKPAPPPPPPLHQRHSQSN